MRETFILLHERLLLTYVMDALEALNDYYVGEVLHESLIELPEVPAEKCEIYEEMEQGGVVLSSNYRKRCFREYWFVYCDQVEF